MRKIIMASVAAAALLGGCNSAQAPSKKDMSNVSEAAFELPKADMPAALKNNTLLAPWSGPYGGVPAFETVKLTDLKPALEYGMERSLAEIDAIANNAAPPTFENTIVAMERTGADLDRIWPHYGIWSSNMSSPEFRAIQGETRNGATLNTEDKARYAAINKRLSELHTTFSNNVLNDEESYVTYLTKDQLGGLPESFIKSSASAAKERGKDGQYAVTNTRSSMSPFLTYSTERDLRQKVWETYYARGDNGDAFDNNAIIAEILQLRDERVGLLGYDNYAQWRLADRMAGTPERAIALMEAVWPAATARAREEVADMQKLADAQGANIKIAPWDYRFYAEQVRKDRYDLDSDEVKAYLLGDKTTGDLVGLWYLDPFARQGKRSGAWATSYRSHTTFDGPKNVLSANNSNFVKGAEGEAVLVSWDDANTFFHEFGHALHSLSSKVVYPTLNGGVRDYTEFQSQLLERWVSTPEVINQFLTHYKTGEPMPAELFAKIENAATFNQGFATTEYLASALVDMRFHTTDPAGIDPDKFERETLAELGMPEEIVMRHRSPHFGHIFSGEGYSAGYYGYMWADVLTSDAAEAFKEAPGGFYDKEVGARLVEHLFAPRNAVDPAEAYRAFRGKDADIGPLMRDRGFAVPE